MPQPDDSRSLGMTLKLAEQRLLRAKSAAIKPAGLTLAQYVALEELERHPGITGAALARASLVTHAHRTRRTPKGVCVRAMSCDVR